MNMQSMHPEVKQIQMLMGELLKNHAPNNESMHQLSILVEVGERVKELTSTVRADIAIAKAAAF